MRTRRRRSLLAVTALLAGSLAAATGGPATGLPARSGRPEIRLPGGISILGSRSFEGSDGHLWTTADVSVNGRVVRGVTAPGGRIGDRWEFVASLPAMDELAQDEHGAGSAHDHGPTGVEAYRMQSGDAAGSTMAADASASDPSSMGPAGFSTLYGYGWCVRNLDAPYWINTAGAPAGAANTIRAGYNVWTHHPASWMSFAYRGGTNVARASSSDGVNSVFFLPDPAAFLGRTWVYGRGTRIVGFDTQFNSRYPLTIGGSGYDLQTLAAHEAGHGAGFGHTSSGGNLMYGGGQARRTYVRSLGAQDRAGLTSLYPYDRNSAKLVGVTAPRSLRAGSVGTVTATWENVGRTPWGAAFGALNVRTGPSPFRDRSWLHELVPVRRTEALCPGERVTMTWKLRAPSRTGRYASTFIPVVGPMGERRWLSASAVNVSVAVVSAPAPDPSPTTSSPPTRPDDDRPRCFLFICW